MLLKKIFGFVLIAFTMQSLQASWLIPKAESDLMKNHNLSRVQAKNYLDLQYAASKGQTKLMQNILQRQEPITFFINIADEDGNTLLHNLVLQNPNNLIEVIKILLTAGADVNMQNNDGDTILHLAINQFNDNKTDENLNILRYLLDPEATNVDINILNKNYESPLSLNREIIRLIVAEQNEKKHNEALKAHTNRLKRLNAYKKEDNDEL